MLMQIYSALWWDPLRHHIRYGKQVHHKVNSRVFSRTSCPFSLSIRVGFTGWKYNYQIQLSDEHSKGQNPRFCHNIISIFTWVMAVTHYKRVTYSLPPPAGWLALAWSLVSCFLFPDSYFLCLVGGGWLDDLLISDWPSLIAPVVPPLQEGVRVSGLLSVAASHVCVSITCIRFGIYPPDISAAVKYNELITDLWSLRFGAIPHASIVLYCIRMECTQQLHYARKQNTNKVDVNITVHNVA